MAETNEPGSDARQNNSHADQAARPEPQRPAQDARSRQAAPVLNPMISRADSATAKARIASWTGPARMVGGAREYGCLSRQKSASGQRDKHQD